MLNAYCQAVQATCIQVHHVVMQGLVCEVSQRRAHHWNLYTGHASDACNHGAPQHWAAGRLLACACRQPVLLTGYVRCTRRLRR